MAEEGEATAQAGSNASNAREGACSVVANKVLFDGKSVSSVTDCLHKQASAYIEIPEPGVLPDVLSRALETEGLCFSMTTATAHPLPLAQIVSDAIARTWPALGLPEDDLATVLNEAFANALLHGNLGVPGADARDPEALKNFYDAVTDRLRDPAFADRRLGIAVRMQDETLLIDVLDEGKGFDMEAALERRKAGPDAFSGRGLAIMESFASDVQVHAPGNRVTIAFSSAPPTAA